MNTFRLDNDASDFDRVLSVLGYVVAAVSDEKGAAARLSKLAKATEEHNAAAADAASAAKELAKQRAEHEKKLADDRSVFEAEMTAARKKLGADREAFDRWCVGLKREAEELKAQAQKDADAASKHRADLQARLAKVQELAAA